MTAPEVSGASSTFGSSAPTRPGGWLGRLSTSRRLVVAALASAVLVLAVATRVGQTLYSDAAWQMRAAQQYARGDSPTPNTVVMPDARDLTRDHAEWISWWAPGTPMLAAPLLRAGLTLAGAVRLIAAICLLVGAAGWGRWIALFRPNRWVALGLAVALPWMRYAHNVLFSYSAEALVFAAVPWMLVATYAAAHRWREAATPPGMPAMFAIGTLLGGAYLLKYSALLPAAGALAYLAARAAARSRLAASSAWLARRKALGIARVRVALPTSVAAARVGALVLGAAIPIVGLSIVNDRLGGTANLVTAGVASGQRLGLGLPELVAAVANPALALTDAESLLSYVLRSPVHPLATDAAMRLIGVPGGLVLLWLALRKRPRRTEEQLAVVTFFASLAQMLVIWTVSKTVSLEARHLATPSIALLPMLVERGGSVVRRGSRVAATVLAGCAALYVGAPLAYGAAAAVGKVMRDGGYVAGPSGVRNTLLAPRDAAACRRALIAARAPLPAVWYSPEALTALDLPGRVVVGDADFGSGETLAAKRAWTSGPLAVFALLSPDLERDGRGEAIRSGFRGAEAWVSRQPADCAYTLWTTTLRPSEP